MVPACAVTFRLLTLCSLNKASAFDMNILPSPVIRKILVVDDDPRLRDLLRRYLTDQGFSVLTAEDSQEMTKIWHREHVDLLVLDLMLPGEDGLSVCRRLRGNHDNTPIIMLTARAEEIDRIIGLEMGADDYLSKPFNPRELLARINALCVAAAATNTPEPQATITKLFTLGPLSSIWPSEHSPATAISCQSPQVNSRF